MFWVVHILCLYYFTPVNIVALYSSIYVMNSKPSLFYIYISTCEGCVGNHAFPCDIDISYLFGFYERGNFRGQSFRSDFCEGRFEISAFPLAVCQVGLKAYGSRKSVCIETVLNYYRMGDDGTIMTVLNINIVLV